MATSCSFQTILELPIPVESIVLDDHAGNESALPAAGPPVRGTAPKVKGVVTVELDRSGPVPSPSFWSRSPSSCRECPW
jgi:hypothetical protein